MTKTFALVARSNCDMLLRNHTDDVEGNWTDMPAFRMQPFQHFNRLVSISFGIPLNLLVIAVVCRSKQLWYPRNITWLAVTFFNLLALVQSVVELGIFTLYKYNDGSHLLLCQLYSIMVGCPFALLLTGLTFGAVERYLAIAHRHFHEKHITPKVTLIILVACVVVVTGGFHNL